MQADPSCLQGQLSCGSWVSLCLGVCPEDLSPLQTIGAGDAACEEEACRGLGSVLLDPGANTTSQHTSSCCWKQDLQTYNSAPAAVMREARLEPFCLMLHTVYVQAARRASSKLLRGFMWAALGHQRCQCCWRSWSPRGTLPCTWGGQPCVTWWGEKQRSLVLASPS